MVREIDQMEEHREAIQADYERLTARYRNMPSHGGFVADMMSTYAVKIDILDRRLLHCKMTLIDRQIDMEDAMERLPSKERQLIRYRYVYGLTWEQVAQRMHYAVDYCKKELHGSAIYNITHNTPRKNVV